MRLLIVSYTFPPVGGAGVQRVLKFAKYLPEYGVAPTVLTAENPSVPVADPSLLDDVPPHVRVVRTRTLEPDYRVKAAVWRDTATKTPAARVRSVLTRAARSLLVPDPQILWLPSAAPALRRLSAEADAVLISGPPFSPFLLSLVARAPVVLDYRDEWRTTSGNEMQGGSLARGAAQALEPALVRRAAAVVTATEEFRENLLQRLHGLDPRRVVTIPNGYDPDDFVGAADAKPPAAYGPDEKFVVTYAGTIFRLTSPRGLLEAVRLLHARTPALARHLEVRFLGRIVDTELPAFEGVPGVRRLGYVPHGEVLRALAESHLLLCLLDDVPGAASVYPAKIFELMHLGRPCLILAPEGALARLSVRHRLGEVQSPRNAEAIAASLARRLEAWRRGEPFDHARPEGIEPYHRRALAGRLAEVISTAMATSDAPTLARTRG